MPFFYSFLSFPFLSTSSLFFFFHLFLRLFASSISYFSYSILFIIFFSISIMLFFHFFISYFFPSSLFPFLSSPILYPPSQKGPVKQPALGRFLLPVAECTFALEQVLEDLQKDPWTCQPDERVQRCTGTALTVALVSHDNSFLPCFLFWWKCAS